MNKIDVLFLDLDGTLLDTGVGQWAKISKNNQEAVCNFSKIGKVVISTGRSFTWHVRKIAESVNASFLVCQNGSLIYDKNFHKIKDKKISSSVVDSIFQIAKQFKASIVANSSFFIYGPFFWNRFFSIFSSFKAKKYTDFKPYETNKILLIHKSQKKINKIFSEIKKHFKDEVSVEIVGKNWAIEITRKDCSKGIAAKEIAKILNVDLKNTIHIGDSMNDSSTKNIVGKLIAVKSGSKKLKKIADEIGPKRRNAGIAKIIKKFI
ncbi:Cof-type HAD-IIB family hydrolase [Mesomycoplasma neurolyticum]|uniref:COF family HAD hydrolase protein n=1 Tax=Mesomycoplasma neurolyticum TaxID=2120 RepID=A0A449A6B6_9BACT|nr:Cof-type HAD-IIB family hydrolase [Mesomycoplasma neurolyticum]VEU59703.1 COF family HAD hydrolase protein [Mesomycoplasma neurolyticum]